MKMRRCVAAVVCALACAGAAVLAQPLVIPHTVSEDAGWSSLSAAQKKLLAPLQSRWGALDLNRRLKWIAVADRLAQLPADEQTQLETRMGQWFDLSASERGATRLQFQQAQRWTPQERQARWEQYQSLHPDARRILAERWKQDAAPNAAVRPPVRADAKRNVVEVAPLPTRPPTAASPTTVRAGSGATSTPMTLQPTPPLAGEQGLPKIKATATFVDPTTLLPRRGAQAADMLAPRTAPDSAR